MAAAMAGPTRSRAVATPAGITAVISWPPSRDVVPEARQLAQRLVVPEARNRMVREARGSGGGPRGSRVSPPGAAARSDAAFGAEARGGLRGVVPPGQHCSPPGAAARSDAAFGPAARGGFREVVPPGQHCSPPGRRDAVAAFGPAAAA